MKHRLPDFASRGALSNWFLGVSYAFGGIRFVMSHSALWKYLVIPTFIAALVFIGALVVTWQYVPVLMAEVWMPGPEAPWLLQVIWYAMTLLLRAFAFLLVGVTMYFSAGIIAIPFNDRLSDHVEELCLGPYEDPFSWANTFVDVSQSVIHSMLSLFIYLFLMALFVFLELFPGFGSAIHLALGTLVTALFLTRETMDGALSRRRMGYRHKLRVLTSNFAVCLGFGMAASALLWIPLLNFVFLPMMVSGGTMLYAHLELRGRVPNREGTGPFVPTRARSGGIHEHEM